MPDKPRMSFKARKRWAIFILLVGLPIYVIVAMEVFVRTTLEADGRLAIGWELPLIAALGILWAFPLKTIFKGIGQADPDAPRDD